MFFRIMDKADVHNLVRGLSTEYQVVGPVEKGDSFTLSVLDDPADLRLEYDTTILPPNTSDSVQERRFSRRMSRKGP